MVIGIPREIKTGEFRVGMTPYGVEDLKNDGHVLLLETGAGEGSDFADEEYRRYGVEIVDRKTLFQRSELIVKVKEPLQNEYDLFENGQAVFTFLHLAANRDLINVFIGKNIIALAYETLQKDSVLPILSPMSEIAGRMAPIMGAYYLQKVRGGSGVLPTGVLGVEPANVLVLGAGVVGTNATRDCIGLGMDTVVMDVDLEKLRKIDEMFMGRIKTLPVSSHNIREEVTQADIIIGAVLIPSAKTPVVITGDMLGTMKKGSVIIDVAVDQGGCFETSRPTTHDNPFYEVEGILHYTVSNMPGAYPKTSTIALTNVTLPYIKNLAGKGIIQTLRDENVIRSAVNTYKGSIVCKALAESLELPYLKLEEMLP